MRATVIIPTFDHGPLLKYSVESALKQTVDDIDIFVVGDGVPAEHREAVSAAVRSDSRIRFPRSSRFIPSERSRTPSMAASVAEDWITWGLLTI
ncbi:MAG TPA: glycosyltransferase family A protein [Thermoanaerobaculia bacterium]|nr:glycosyltransferase family A protein [Thermoanaerobaculia bacterium]